MRYIDKKDWNNASFQKRYSTNVAEVSIGATSITMATTGDLPLAGSIIFQSSDYITGPLSITYTGNNLNTNTLSGVTGVTRVIPISSQGWAYTALNYPRFYTVYDDKIVFDSAIPTQLNGVNLYIDYYKAYEDLYSLKDEIPEHYADIYKNYLRFAIKRRRDDTIGESDPDYVRFKKAAESIFSNDYLGISIRIT
jgi:cation transport regulator ChaB